MFSTSLSRTLLLSVFASVASAATIQIDFGSPTTTGWNNVTTTGTGIKIADLVDSAAQSTGIQLEITDAFLGTNLNGTTSTSSGFPVNATSDSFYGIGAGLTFSGNTEDDGNSTIVFSGLASGTTYTFRFYASRTGVNDNRETRYEVIGANSDIVDLDASKNVTNTVVSTAITADANGKITLNVSGGPNNTNTTGFYYLGLIEITTASAVPEPASWAVLAGLCAVGVAALRRWRGVAAE